MPGRQLLPMAGRRIPSPDLPGPAAFAGSDRQARGRIISILRSAQDPVATSAIESAWHDNDQVARALVGLLKDALIEETALGDYQLRGSR